MKLRHAFACLLGVFVATAQADIRFRNFDDPDAVQWSEEEVSLPPLPRDEDLLEFYVSAVATNHFYIDTASISVGKDGVVRYTLVVRAGGGAVNIAYEGIRCDTRELRRYAMGKADGTWAKSRDPGWRPIENKPVNRHHAALSRELFCPNGVPLANPEEGREALRLGNNPRASSDSWR